MNPAHRILLQSGASGDYVDAQLYERIDPTYAKTVDDAWLTYVAAEEVQAKAQGTPFVAPEHAHWSWHKKVSLSSHLLSSPTLAIECQGQAQGLMLLMTDGYFGQLHDQLGKPLVYVMFLAAAPWNLRAMVQNPRFRGVGTILMRAAVQASLDLGFKGRIGLHSLPQAEGFYNCHGLVCLGPDAEKENLKYYELSPEGAAAFIG